MLEAAPPLLMKVLRQIAYLRLCTASDGLLIDTQRSVAPRSDHK